jgi:hypothetical protein
LEPQRQKDKKTRKKPMGIAEEEDTEGVVAKEVENQTNEPIIFHLCFVKFFFDNRCALSSWPPVDFVPCSVTALLGSELLLVRDCFFGSLEIKIKWQH